jgi:ubiquinone/menaquinone biosynthesis C-methylase UbiE
MPRVCPAFLSFFLDNRFRTLLFNTDKILKPYVREGMTVADIGCGPGFFTVPLARLVGPAGRVFAVDLQQAMLDKVRRKAVKSGIEGRITLHKCGADSLGLKDPLDFALCFWMMHEVPSPDHLLAEIRALVKPGGLLLIAEPFAHVRRKRFDATVACAIKAGFAVVSEPKIRGSYAALLTVSNERNAK